MRKKSKFFRVAVEGATTDGRHIQRSWLEQIVETYNTTKYAARIFIEHIRGYDPESSFRAMGTVIGVKTGEVEIDGEKRLALFAQIEANEHLLALNKADQKIFSSIEVNPNFMDSGKAYLMGLGVTDSPASLGTDILAFAAQHPEANPFAGRKQHKDNLFSAAEEMALDFEAEDTDTGPSLLERVRQMFSARRQGDAERLADVHAAVEQVAEVAGEASTAAGAATSDLASFRTDIDARLAQMAERLDGITERIDHTEQPGTQRPAATGGDGADLTDC